jgi:hypothetical protein
MQGPGSLLVITCCLANSAVLRPVMPAQMHPSASNCFHVVKANVMPSLQRTVRHVAAPACQDMRQQQDDQEETKQGESDSDSEFCAEDGRIGRFSSARALPARMPSLALVHFRLWSLVMLKCWMWVQLRVMCGTVIFGWCRGCRGCCCRCKVQGALESFCDCGICCDVNVLRREPER